MSRTIQYKKFQALTQWLMITIGYLIFMGVTQLSNMPDDILRTVCVATVTVYILCMVVWYRYTHKIASLYFVFFLFCFLFNAGQILVGIWSFNFSDIVNIYKSYSNVDLARMMFFQTNCVLASTLGALLAYNEEPYMQVWVRSDIEPKPNRITMVELVFFIIAAMLMISYFGEVSRRGIASYGEYYYGEREGISVPLLFLYHVFMYRIMLTRNKDLVAKIVMGINVVIAIVMLMVGSRNAILQIVFGLLYIFLYARKVKIHLSGGRKILMIAVGFFAILFLTGVQELRQYSLAALSPEVFLEVFSNSLGERVTGALTQMGGSARCVVQTMLQIDNGAPHEGTIVYSILKSFVPVQLINLFGIQMPVNQSLSAWITEVGGSLSGWGYSIFAEAYYNFGGFGFLYLFIWGYLYVACEQWALKLISRHRYWEGCSLIYVLAYGIFISRADSILITTRTRYCLYVFIICYLVRYFSNKSTNKVVKENII